mgnify:CR=1 FL=1
MVEKLRILVLEDPSDKGRLLESIAKQFTIEVDVRYFGDIFPGNKPIDYDKYDVVFINPNVINYIGNQVHSD